VNYLTLENVSKSFGEKILFDRINLTIAKSQKIALIAKNGTGKTSLLRIIAGEEAPEGENARILVNKDIRIGYLKQETVFPKNVTVLEAALDGDNEQIKAIRELEAANLKQDSAAIQNAIEKLEDLKAWDIEARIKEILGRLQIHDMNQAVSTLSGGQRKRLALARILIDNPDFLILDEPTNHLDTEMIEWLEEYLSRSELTLFMVTHDRYFLQRVCNEIVELERAELFVYRGNYSDYLEKKSARTQNEKTRLDKDKKLFKKELEWIRRQPKARGTKAKARVYKFQEIKKKAHQNISEDEISIEIDMHRLGSKILELHNISKSYGDKKIIKNFSYKFKKAERIGLAGPNGSGKTSVIKVFTKAIPVDSGKVIIGDTVRFGYYSQTNEELKADWRIIDAVRDIAEYLPLKKGRKLTAESLLEKFLFPRSQQQVYVSQLSGGEKRRLMLLRVLMGNPNFLILDEPTNDLDIISLNVLEDFLQSYKGCLLITSHDRFFMDKLVDHLFILTGEGEIKDFNGTYSDYKKSLKQTTKKSIAVPSVTETKEKESQVTQEKERKLSYKKKMELEKIEKEIQKLEKRKAEIEKAFQEKELEGHEIQELSIEMGQIEKTISDHEDRWLELSEFA
jgi:ATP-binding cassette subfamily F protein uup